MQWAFKSFLSVINKEHIVSLSGYATACTRSKTASLIPAMKRITNPEEGHPVIFHQFFLN